MRLTNMTLFVILRRMKLIDWRLREKLTLSSAAVFFGLVNARTYQRYETGENRPDAPLAQIFCDRTGGQVSIVDLHETRLSWLGAHAPEKLIGELSPVMSEAAE